MLISLPKEFYKKTISGFCNNAINFQKNNIAKHVSELDVGLNITTEFKDDVKEIGK